MRRYFDTVISTHSHMKVNIIKGEMKMENRINHKGKEYTEYLLTRDGFSLLVMGFTGSKALEWKLKYIEAFNKMEEELRNSQKPLTPIEMMELQFSIIKEQVLARKDTPAYRELSKKVFSNFWKTYRLAFHVGSYKDTAKKNYEEAIKYIKSWEPSKELGYMITGANSQLQFNN